MFRTFLRCASTSTKKMSADEMRMFIARWHMAHKLGFTKVPNAEAEAQLTKWRNEAQELEKEEHKAAMALR